MSDAQLSHLGASSDRLPEALHHLWLGARVVQAARHQRLAQLRLQFPQAALGEPESVLGLLCRS